MTTINDLANYINFMINGNENIICKNSLSEIMSPIILLGSDNQKKI